MRSAAGRVGWRNGAGSVPRLVYPGREEHDRTLAFLVHDVDRFPLAEVGEYHLASAVLDLGGRLSVEHAADRFRGFHASPYRDPPEADSRDRRWRRCDISGRLR